VCVFVNILLFVYQSI